MCFKCLGKIWPQNNEVHPVVREKCMDLRQESSYSPANNNHLVFVCMFVCYAFWFHVQSSGQQYIYRDATAPLSLFSDFLSQSSYLYSWWALASAWLAVHNKDFSCTDSIVLHSYQLWREEKTEGIVGWVWSAHDTVSTMDIPVCCFLLVQMFVEKWESFVFHLMWLLC